MAYKIFTPAFQKFNVGLAKGPPTPSTQRHDFGKARIHIQNDTPPYYLYSCITSV